MNDSLLLFHHFHGHFHRKYRRDAVIRINADVFRETPDAIARVHCSLHASNGSRLEVIGTDHRCGTASGRLDLLYDQLLGAHVLDLEYLRDLRTLGNLA